MPPGRALPSPSGRIALLRLAGPGLLIFIDRVRHPGEEQQDILVVVPDLADLAGRAFFEPDEEMRQGNGGRPFHAGQ